MIQLIRSALIAAELGIDEVLPDLRPEDKVQAIERLRAEHGQVAMVGDGINEPPALARADLGIAMGTGGTDAAIEAADVALMADDLNKVAEALRLGRRAQRISRQNLVFSIGLLAFLIPSALVGALTVVAAVLVHEDLRAARGRKRGASRAPADTRGGASAGVNSALGGACSSACAMPGTRRST